MHIGKEIIPFFKEKTDTNIFVRLARGYYNRFYLTPGKPKWLLFHCVGGLAMFGLLVMEVPKASEEIKHLQHERLVKRTGGLLQDQHSGHGSNDGHGGH